jgi:hypothetical protein
MLLRYTASADNTIVNAFQPNLKTRATGANAGAADVLETFSIFGRYSSGSQELSRILINFPIKKISDDRTAGTLPASGSVNFYLKLFNAPSSKTVPADYTLSVLPIAQSWQEGEGLDLEGYKDLTRGEIGSNWVSASKTTAWTGSNYSDTSDTVGGSYRTGAADPQYAATFAKGTEDLEVDITSLVEHWVAETIPNYGIGIHFSSSFEASASAATNASTSSVLPITGGAAKSYYTKRFFGRETQYFFRKPIIEARWDSSKRDDRANFYFSSSRAPAADNLNTLYFYNIVRGRLVNIPGIGTSSVMVSLFSGSETNVDPSGSALALHDSTTAATGGYVSTGIYSCSVCLPSSSVKTIYDVWFSGSDSIGSADGTSNQYFTGTIKPMTIDGGNTSAIARYYLSMPNLQQGYLATDTVRMNLFVREKNWSPNIYTVATNTVESHAIISASYRVYRTLDSFEAISYGTGSDYHTMLSYDVSGSYFNLDMNLLEPGYSYGLKFAFYDSDTKSWREQTQTFKFRVESYEY